MNFLYEKIDTLKEAGIDKEIPSFMLDNLSPGIKLRDYQKEAIKNTLIFLESNLSKNKQTHILYHMATGAGKTVIMALDILYYYNKGYRNFLFFTNQTNIVSKTKINFLEKTSLKYLFSNTISINGKNVRINEVSNFEDADSDAINICFNTVQGIHSSLGLIREGALTIEDFENEKIVLIADEAHHLNSTTSADKVENEDNATWEDTVHRIFSANKDNVLLEYTATCDIQDSNVCRKYMDKIVFNFDLKEFRRAGYTKEFLNLRSNTSKWERTLQAIILSEYRKLLFENHNVTIKPVVLLKSKTISDSNAFYKEFYDKLKSLTPKDIENIKVENNKNDIFVDAFEYFSINNITDENLVNLIQIDFSQEHSVNMNALNPENEYIVNNLDEKGNLFRLIFIVDKLTEGWDVLSLFDIVRLYETRQSGSGGKISKYTISEAQLIGRGARYCQFKFDNNQMADRRKYSDYTNPLSICETLLYHCKDDSKYIDEITKALKQTGLLPETDKKVIKYQLKDSFKKTKIYKEGFVFLNKRIEVSRENVKSLPEKIRTHGISHRCKSASTTAYAFFADEETKRPRELKETLPIKVSSIDYTIVYKAFRCYHHTLSFTALKRLFPKLESVNKFLTSEEYIGGFPIAFILPENSKLTREDQCEAVKTVLQIVSDYIQSIETTYQGTKEFYATPIKDVFTDRERYISREKNDESWGMGVSQNAPIVNDTYRLDLSDKEWYAYNDNFGTSEEKMFVKYFSGMIGTLRAKFKDVYLIRNEIQACIYSFADGSKFEPDFLLVLNKDLKNKTKKNLYICMFIEPKGQHLLQVDSWKNTLLLELTEKGIPTVKFVDDNEYLIWGSPLYNESETKSEFKSYFEELLENI